MPATRRALLAFALAGAERLTPIIVRVNVMFDQAAHNNQGLTGVELQKFERMQARAAGEYMVSGIVFDLVQTPGAFLRQQGYSEIPERFLRRDAINVFVALALGYDVDRDRTGGASSGPRKRDPYYRTYLGLNEASDTTLLHEYSHHLSLDTTGSSSVHGNLWADLRNDWLLWRQRRGVPVGRFRECIRAKWARTG